MNNDTTTPLTFASDEGSATQPGLGGLPNRQETDQAPTDTTGVAGISCLNGSDAGEPPSADFIEPVQYEWTESAYEARQALKKYSEETHADY